MMLNRLRFFLTQINIKACAKNLVIPFSFVVPIFMLFVLDPNSFNYTWKGRTFYLFFLWLLFLEIILDWEKITKRNLASLRKLRIVVIGITASVPIVYVIGVVFLGLDQTLIEMGKQILTFWHFSLDNLQHWPISLEYLIFTIVFSATIWLAYEFDGLKQFSISLCLLGAIGIIYMIDTFYPFGAFTPFQAFVPLTGSLAANVLNWMGYNVIFGEIYSAGTPILEPAPPISGFPGFGIAWPCAGVQSLFIYTCVILLFFKKSTIPVIQRIIYFIIGAIGTYFVNILRIVTIYIIALSEVRALGVALHEAKEWQTFHNFYGELYSITWIVAYLIIIILSRTIPAKLSLLKAKLQKLTLQSDDCS